ncbi:MAG TPA: NlpC/P60 family protein [Clostridia bacterium]
MSRGRLRSRRFVGLFHRTSSHGRGNIRSTGTIDPISPWNLKGRDAYVDPEKRKRLPLWFAPALAVVLIVILVFWGAPAAVAKLRPMFGSGNGLPKPTQTQYGSRTMVVRLPVADVFETADLRAARLTQALYNEPVELTGIDASYGFVKVRLQDGVEGYMRLDDLTTGHGSIEPGKQTSWILVTDLTKRIYSHASNGTLLAEAMMGTVLYSDYTGDGVFRVTLPSGETGWIGSNGVMNLPMSANSVPRSDSGRYFANSALSFLNVPYIINGMTRDGACPEGIAKIAAAVNGISLPRSVEGQMMAGTRVEIRRDEKGSLVYDDMQRGDLVFFSSPIDPAKPGQMGIYVDYAQVLTYRIGRSDIRIINLSENESLANNLLAVRRLFP